jgi:hypothetical protein
MFEYQIGDLVQYHIEPTVITYRRLLQNKIGLIRDIRNKQRLAYIVWADLDTSSQWVSYDDMRLLSRE